MIHVLDGEGYRDAVDVKCLELEASHRAGVVLQQHLIHTQLELLAQRERTPGQVSTEKLGDQRLCHADAPSFSDSLP